MQVTKILHCKSCYRYVSHYVVPLVLEIGGSGNTFTEVAPVDLKGIE